MTELALKLSGVTKANRKKPIGPMDLQIPAGFVTAVVGPNGSGKSTLLHLILKSIQPDKGQIEWYGQPYERMLPEELRQQIAYVPENSIYEENQMTAEQAGEFRSRWYPAWDERKFEDLLGGFHVPRATRLSKMSKGERRKFEIAAAIACQPRLLLLDEPSSGLDPFSWKSMIEALRTLMLQEDVTIVICTHIVDELKRLADYIILVDQGQVHGMMEKDALVSCFQEWWVRGGQVEAAKLGGFQIENEWGVMRLMINNSEEAEQAAEREHIEVLRRRGVELDEALELWMKGHLPKELYQIL